MEILFKNVNFRFLKIIFNKFPSVYPLHPISRPHSREYFFTSQRDFFDFDEKKQRNYIFYVFLFFCTQKRGQKMTEKANLSRICDNTVQKMKIGAQNFYHQRSATIYICGQLCNFLFACITFNMYI